MQSQPVGGGAKKILYALNTLRQIGVVKSAKALSANNTCKACGLGMGGQKGGMTNEAGEFPSVCNKSVQAQSTDIQPVIPSEILNFPLVDLASLSGREIEHLGRLGSPIYKPKGGEHYREIGWDAAMQIAADRFADTAPDRSFFYASGRSSNEAGFLFQLIARIYGTNNVNNCSFYCHQATSVALGTTIGTGTSTVELDDLDGCDLIFIIGANPASNHPRLIHKLQACRARGGQVVVINPAKEPGLVKFALPKSPKSLLIGGSEIASAYLQPRIGSDVALFKGLAKAVLEIGAQDAAFIDAHSHGFDDFAADIAATGWDEITALTGLAQADISSVAALYAHSKASIFAWGMGMTHQLNGVENIEYIANLALLRGMVGKPNAGLLPLRGHSNVQGIGTIGVKPVLSETVVAKMEELYGIELPTATGMDTMACMHAAHAGTIDAALLMGGNLLASNPDSRWATQAMDRIGFRLCLTTTLNHSHMRGVAGEMLILPVAARDEEWEPTTQESMFNFVRMSDGGIRRHANVRPESVILADLAQRLLPDCPIDFAEFGKHRKLRQAIAKIIPDMQDLADIDVARQEFHVANRLLHSPQFQTPTGRAHFRVQPMPGPDGSTPFTLSTIRSEGQFNSIIYEEQDSYRQTKTRWSVLMAPQDMAELALAKGELANVRSPQGEMTGVTVYPFDLPRGNMMAYYPEANVLTSNRVDPRSKTPSFKSTGVWVDKVR